MDYYRQGTVQPFIHKKFISKEELDQLTGKGYPEDDEYSENYTNLSFEINPQGEYYFFFNCDDVFGENAENVFHRILMKMPLTVPAIYIEIANTGSKMAPDSHGGSACVISRDKIEWMSTNAFISDKTKEAKKHLDDMNKSDIKWNDICVS